MALDKVGNGAALEIHAYTATLAQEASIAGETEAADEGPFELHAKLDASGPRRDGEGMGFGEVIVNLPDGTQILAADLLGGSVSAVVSGFDAAITVALKFDAGGGLMVQRRGLVVEAVAPSSSPATLTGEIDVAMLTVGARLEGCERPVIWKQGQCAPCRTQLWGSAFGHRSQS